MTAFSIMPSPSTAPAGTEVPPVVAGLGDDAAAWAPLFLDVLRATQGSPLDGPLPTEAPEAGDGDHDRDDTPDASKAGVLAGPELPASAEMAPALLAMQPSWWSEGAPAQPLPLPRTEMTAVAAPGLQAAIAGAPIVQAAVPAASIVPAVPVSGALLQPTAAHVAAGLPAQPAPVPPPEHASPLEQASSLHRASNRREDLGGAGTQPSLQETASRAPRSAEAAPEGGRNAQVTSDVLPSSFAPQASPDAGPRTREATPADPATRQPALMQALGERIKVQVTQGSERAVIRLDPPMMGRLEIVIRHEAGALQVQLHATHGDVARQLQQMSDGLRQELGQRHFSDVSVVVSHGAERDSAGRQRQGQERETPDAPPGRALAEAEIGHELPLFTLA